MEHELKKTALGALLLIASTILVGCTGPSTSVPRPTDKVSPAPIIPVSRTLQVAPYGDAARNAGIRPLAHNPTAPHQAPDGTDFSGLLVEPGVPTPLKGIRNGIDADCWLGNPFEVDYGQGAIADLLIKWIETDKEGHATITAPREADGVVLQLSGCDDQDHWTKKDLALGARAIGNWHFYENHYLNSRRNDLSPPRGTPDADQVKRVNVSPIVLFNADADLDGQADLVGFNHVRWVDDQGDQLAEGGEMGVIWGGRDGTSTAQFGLDQGSIFPRLLVVPAALSGGHPMLFSVLRCCGGTSFRAFNLKSGDVFDEEIFQAQNGDREVFLTTGENETATLSMGKSLD